MAYKLVINGKDGDGDESQLVLETEKPAQAKTVAQVCKDNGAACKVTRAAEEKEVDFKLS